MLEQSLSVFHLTDSLLYGFFLFGTLCFCQNGTVENKFAIFEQSRNKFDIFGGQKGYEFTFTISEGWLVIA